MCEKSDDVEGDESQSHWCCGLFMVGTNISAANEREREERVNIDELYKHKLC